jgi:hypothetical protein
MHAVLTWMTAKGISIRQVHEHATDLMGHFLERLEPLRLKGLMRRDLITHSAKVLPTGTFLVSARTALPRSRQRSRPSMFTPIVAAIACASVSALRARAKRSTPRLNEWPTSWQALIHVSGFPRSGSPMQP